MEARRDAFSLFVDHFRLSGGGPGLDMLRAFVASYSDIPYENLTKIIKKYTTGSAGNRFRLPLEVISGYIERHTGGTCFSLTYCLDSILSRAGFPCYTVMADMKRPNIHCALVVTVGGGRYLVDPGYLLGEPLRLADVPVRVRSPFGTVELRPGGGSRFDLYTVTDGEVRWRYRLKNEPVSRELFMRYWRESFSLPMMNSLQLTKLTPDGHLYVRNHHLRLRRSGVKMNENIRHDLEQRIEGEFGIPGSVTAEARELIERMKHACRIHGPEGRGRLHR